VKAIINKVWEYYKMKKKKGPWIFTAVILVLIIAGSLIINYWTHTNYGRLNTEFAIMLKYSNYFYPHSFKNMPIDKIREYMDNRFARWSSKPIPFNNIKNIDVNTPSAKVPVRIYTPDSGTTFPVIIYSHGGAWIGGSINDYENVCRKLSKNTNAVIVSVEYRLAPEHPFPAGLNDVYNVLQWAYKNAAVIHGNANQIAVVGDSAGGNFSAVISQMARDRKGPPITCQVLIYPSTNIYELNTKSWSYFENGFDISRDDMKKSISLYVPRKEDRKNPYVSPLLSENLKNLPPALVITAEFDPLRDEGEAYGEKLKGAGAHVVVTRYKGVTHGFINMDKFSNQADTALNQICLYLQREFQKNK
jgi:acetyl esterase